jgi:hypothetical protein
LRANRGRRKLAHLTGGEARESGDASRRDCGNEFPRYFADISPIVIPAKEGVKKLGDLDSHGASFDKPGDEDFS